MCLKADIGWKAWKDERDWDIRVSNPRLPNLRIFQGLKKRKSVRMTSRVYSVYIDFITSKES